MSIMRFGGVLQPEWARATSRVVENTRTAFAIRLQPAIDQTTLFTQQAIEMIAALLTPAAVVAFVFGLWRLGMDLGWTDRFIIGSGLFSHWQVWLALAGGLQVLAVMLSRSGQRSSDDSQAG